MALNRYLYPQKGTNIVQEVMLSTRVSIGAAGAITGIIAGRGLTITRTGAGAYTVTLDNASSVYQVVHVDSNVTFTPYAAGNHVQVAILSVSQTGCTFQCINPQNGAASDPPQGSELSVAIVATLSAVGA